MKYHRWKINLKYPLDPAGAIVEDRKRKSGFLLNPAYTELQKPQRIHDLVRASEIIKKTIKDKKIIGIFMDYDADGVCAGAILYRAINWQGGSVKYYVPQRHEGYGLSKLAIDHLAKQKVKLIITADCGIKNIEEVKYAKSLGLNVIITDHHLMDKIVPKADAIVHPAFAKNLVNYSGAGVSFQLSRYFLSDIPRTKWLLDLAAISTVADIVPLVGDNRILVKYGTLVINKTKNLGLGYLIKETGLSEKNIGTYEIGYLLAPRLNAAGRLANPEDSFKLLVTRSRKEANILAKKLNKYNEVRQQQLSDAIAEAFETIRKRKLERDNLIIIEGDWNEGIVGLIAGKITEYYYRPAIVLTKINGKLKGSARSVKGINITAILKKVNKYLLSFGGHNQAAGLSLNQNNKKLFMRAIKREANKISKDRFKKILEVDALCKIEDITVGMVEQLEQLAPFGMGNPRPVLCVKKARIEAVQLVGREQKHLSVSICTKSGLCKGIIFDYQDGSFTIEVGKQYDLAFRVDINEWQGRRKVSLVTIDAKKSY